MSTIDKKHYDMKKHNDERIKNLKKKRLSKTEKDKKIREKIYSNKTARRKRNLDGKRKSKTFKNKNIQQTGGESGSIVRGDVSKVNENSITYICNNSRHVRKWRFS